MMFLKVIRILLGIELEVIWCCFDKEFVCVDLCVMVEVVYVIVREMDIFEMNFLFFIGIIGRVI